MWPLMGFNFHFTLGPLSAFPSIFSSYHIPLLTFVESFQYITFKKKNPMDAELPTSLVAVGNLLEFSRHPPFI